MSEWIRVVESASVSFCAVFVPSGAIAAVGTIAETFFVQEVLSNPCEFVATFVRVAAERG
ncbi:hypothetical protein C7H84_33070 [Burkholderia sp. Nafp2/4-1b]|nr:hypothetical protein C7H84_33070 [Burkholderia sp. Nafp2/4-1b]